MALRCLTFLQFSCFRPDITEKKIAHYIRIGEYLWLEYAQTNWLEHVRLGGRANQDSLQRLDSALHSFLARWKNTDATEQSYHGTLDGSMFGLDALREISSENYQLLVSGAMYKSQKRFHENMKDPFSIGDFAKRVFQQLESQASLFSGLDNRRNLEDLHLFYGTNLFKCQIQHCPFSVKGFRFKAECDLHSKDHQKSFKCHINTCNYSKIGFSTASELRLHVSRHSTIEKTTDRIANLRLSQGPFPVPRQRRPDELFEDAVASGDMKYVASAVEVDKSIIKEYREGKSTLLLAVKKNQVQIVEFLLDRGADVNSEERAFKQGRWYTSLELAVDESSIEMVRTLLLHNVDFEVDKGAGKRALSLAIENEDISKIELLLEFGADPFLDGEYEPRFLKEAVSTGNLEICQFLVHRFACSSEPFDKALILALTEADRKNSEAFQLILKECNERAIDWGECLVRAVSVRNYQCAQIALEKGADVNHIYNRRSRSADNKTALTILARITTKEAALLIKLLLEKGADPSIIFPSGRSLGSYAGARNIQRWLGGVTWEELVQANAHKVIRTSDSQSPAEKSQQSKGQRPSKRSNVRQILDQAD
ncbi:hypothetical protein MMC22_002498 [Lobaria immixta]|nr:hypothetical protein [Lobaria immixta]